MQSVQNLSAQRIKRALPHAELKVVVQVPLWQETQIHPDVPTAPTEYRVDAGVAAQTQQHPKVRG